MKKYTSFKSLFTNRAKIRKAYGRQIANLFGKSFMDTRDAIALFDHTHRRDAGGFNVRMTAEMTAIAKHIPITHYFVDPGVAEFCRDSVREENSDYYRGFNLEMIEAYTVRGKAAMFHFPSNSPHRSMMVLSEVETVKKHPSTNDHERIDLIICDGKDISITKFITGKDLDGNKKEGIPVHVTSDTYSYTEEERNKLKIAMGLSMYMEAFPDAIVNHEEIICLNNNRNKCKARRITPSEVMDEEGRNSVSPHWRRGHFRVLTSERYKEENRGKAVFVRGTFVKGKKAYDIREDAPATH